MERFWAALAPLREQAPFTVAVGPERGQPKTTISTSERLDGVSMEDHWKTILPF